MRTSLLDPRESIGVASGIAQSVNEIEIGTFGIRPRAVAFDITLVGIDGFIKTFQTRICAAGKIERVAGVGALWILRCDALEICEGIRVVSFLIEPAPNHVSGFGHVRALAVMLDD